MASKWKGGILTAALIMSSFSSATARPKDGQPWGDDDHHKIRHVLLISVDGMHALDLTTYVASHTDSTLAKLSEHGITYSKYSSPSESRRSRVTPDKRVCSTLVANTRLLAYRKGRTKARARAPPRRAQRPANVWEFQVK